MALLENEFVETGTSRHNRFVCEFGCHYCPIQVVCTWFRYRILPDSQEVLAFVPRNHHTRLITDRSVPHSRRRVRYVTIQVVGILLGS
jgi:hypothetical protein